MTMTCIDTFESEVAERTAKASHDWTHVRTFEHADGSFTFIHIDEFGRDFSNPREFDGNIATLVNESRDYYDMDEPDGGLQEARERWDIGHARYDERTYTVNGEELVVRYDREAMVKRYIAIFRPDILHYEDEWSVSGYSQSDWQNGWGFVTRDDYEKHMLADGETLLPPSFETSGAWMAALGDRKRDVVAPAECFEQERDVYEQYFRGDIYVYDHIEKGDPIYEADFTGDTLVGHEYSEDSCGGFLGYDSLKDIAEQATDSPVVSES